MLSSDCRSYEQHTPSGQARVSILPRGKALTKGKHMTENDDLLTTTEVAKLLHVHRTTVAGWIKAGILDAVDIRSGPTKRPIYRVSRANVDQLLSPLPRYEEADR